jgi:hypothetical protein
MDFSRQKLLPRYRYKVYKQGTVPKGGELNIIAG